MIRPAAGAMSVPPGVPMRRKPLDDGLVRAQQYLADTDPIQLPAPTAGASAWRASLRLHSAPLKSSDYRASTEVGQDWWPRLSA